MTSTTQTTKVSDSQFISSFEWDEDYMYYVNQDPNTYHDLTPEYIEEIFEDMCSPAQVGHEGNQDTSGGSQLTREASAGLAGVNTSVMN